MEINAPPLVLDSKLLANIHKHTTEIEELSADLKEMWSYEDYVYRYYHTSFKVYGLQHQTLEIVELLKKFDPKDVPALNEDFMTIINDGTGKKWKMEDNKNWAKVCRPMVEAFFHAKYMLDMVLKYGAKLEEATNSLPSGWAAVLYLYNIR